MLQIIGNLKDLAFGELMAVYAEGNRENGEEFWPELSAGEQILRAEQDFYQYLREVFFRTKGAVYCIWLQKGHYVSALRLEPYKDGLLLEALETLPEARRQGHAKALIFAVLAQYKGQKIYSHVGKRNAASLNTHLACGFRRVSEQAVYADGSVNDRCCTLMIM